MIVLMVMGDTQAKRHRPVASENYQFYRLVVTCQFHKWEQAC